MMKVHIYRVEFFIRTRVLVSRDFSGKWMKGGISTNRKYHQKNRSKIAPYKNYFIEIKTY